MKINKIKINSYGKLKNKEINLENNLNIIYGKNESGKSTLLKFILNIFYGASKNKKGKDISDFEKYKPWDSEEYSGKLTYELDNKNKYEIYREFNKKNPNIFNEQGEEISNKFNINKKNGNEFFVEQTNIDSKMFLATSISLQQEVKFGKDIKSMLLQKISNMLGTGQDNISYKESIDKLNKLQLEKIGTERTKERPINIINKKYEENQEKINLLKIEQNLKEQNQEKINQLKKEINENKNKRITIVSHATAISFFIKNKIYKNKNNFIFFVFCILSIPIAIYCWRFTSSTVSYANRMLSSASILIILFLLMVEELQIKRIFKNVFTVLIALMIFNNSLIANICYFYLQQENDTTLSRATEMLSIIYGQGKNIDEKIFINGSRLNDVAIDDKYDVSQILCLSPMIEKDLLFDEYHTVSYLNNSLNCSFSSATKEEKEEIINTNEYKNMPVWPIKGSIRVIDDIIVIKYTD